MGSARLIVASLVLLALAGCGGEKSQDDRSGGAAGVSPPADTAAPKKERERARADAGQDREDREDGGDARDGKKDAAKRKPTSDKSDRDAEPADKRAKEKLKPADRPDEAKPRGDGSANSTPRVTPPPLSGPALRRCMVRSVRLRGSRRLRAQARCLRMSPARLRRLIVVNCRRATKSEAAARRCVRLAIGE